MHVLEMYFGPNSLIRYWKSWVKFLQKMKWEFRHCICRDCDISDHNKIPREEVECKLFVETLLPRLFLIVLPSGFYFQQDGAPAHMAKLDQHWIATNSIEFIGKDQATKLAWH